MCAPPLRRVGVRSSSHQGLEIYKGVSSSVYNCIYEAICRNYLLSCMGFFSRVTATQLPEDFLLKNPFLIRHCSVVTTVLCSPQERRGCGLIPAESTNFLNVGCEIQPTYQNLSIDNCVLAYYLLSYGMTAYVNSFCSLLLLSHYDDDLENICQYLSPSEEVKTRIPGIITLHSEKLTVF